MSNDTSIDAINELEQQLSKELDSFIKDESNHTESFLTKLNAFENAKIDSETEATFDKLQVLMLQCSDFKKQIELLERERSIFVTENNALKNEVALLKTTDKSVSDHDDIIFGSTSSSNESQVLDLQSRLNRALTAQADHQLARSVAEKELVQERIRRMRSEKERDAYAAAYEASLKHFDRWSQKKNVKRQSSSAKHVESVDSNELTNKIES